MTEIVHAAVQREHDPLQATGSCPLKFAGTVTTVGFQPTLTPSRGATRGYAGPPTLELLQGMRLPLEVASPVVSSRIARWGRLGGHNRVEKGVVARLIEVVSAALSVIARENRPNAEDTKRTRKIRPDYHPQDSATKEFARLPNPRAPVSLLGPVFLTVPWPTRRCLEALQQKVET